MNPLTHTKTRTQMCIAALLVIAKNCSWRHHLETFLDDGNVPYLDWGVGYESIKSHYTFKICAFHRCKFYFKNN